MLETHDNNYTSAIVIYMNEFWQFNFKYPASQSGFSPTLAYDKNYPGADKYICNKSNTRMITVGLIRIEIDMPM